MHRMNRIMLALMVGLLLLLAAPITAQDSDDLNLHVPSPEWQDQIIYFLMIDRFNDGDPSNNDFGMGEYNPSRNEYFNGGDLQGIIDQLDYIQGLGATAIWITPPVANQWWDPVVNFGGYHGYWAENFMEVDAHFGDLQTYKALSDGLHDRGMYLIQDIVANHTGNFFTYRAPNGNVTYNPADPTEFFRLNTETVPVTAPSQYPFTLNDVTDSVHRDMAIYNFTPPIFDFNDPQQRLYWQLADLDDLNTENPLVRDALRRSFGYWIDEVGVDGFRIDTVIYVEHDFWNDFIHSTDDEYPGINAVAAATGRDSFLTFGEAFIGSAPLDDAGDREVRSYIGTPEEPELMSVLNFPMHFTINRVFGEGAPTHHMTYRIEKTFELYPDPYILPVFIDNHDVTRFLAKSSTQALQQGLLFMMTTPGIPIVYYGTEQGLTEGRTALFEGGYMNPDGEHGFDTNAPLYQYIAQVSNMRTDNRIFTRGTIDILQDNETGAGVLAYRRDYEGDTAIVIFNTSDRPVLMTDLETGLPAGTVLDLMLGLVSDDNLTVGADGSITMELAAREGLVLMATDEMVALDETEATITIDTAIEGQLFTQDVMLSGTVSQPEADLRLILNGNLAAAMPFSADADGNWSVNVPVTNLPPGLTTNTLTVYAPDLAIATETLTFEADVVASGSSITVFDMRGDDVGPNHSYQLPTDDSFGDQLDILETQVTASGTNLEVKLTMADVTDVWNPTNGFDHVLFHIFIDVPGRDGITDLPRINAQAPDGMAWDYMAFLEGWNTRFYSSEGATADEYGQAITPAPAVVADKEARTITMLFTSDALGNPETLEGAQVYVATWDWNGPDSEYRPLRPDEGQWNFSGGDGSLDPLILDDTGVITVPVDTRLVAFDPAGDDTGPMGTYELPTDDSFNDQMDILKAVAIPSGTNLQLEMHMAEVTDVWNPANGFDHVLFQIYIDVPGRDGVTDLPRINAQAPDGMAWDYMAFLEGWNTRFYSSEGATADEYGQAITPAPEVMVDKEAGIISTLFTAEALGNPETLDGVTVYITTWDWNGPDSEYRRLTPDGGQWIFAGGDGSVDPLILDSALIGLPAQYVSPLPEIAVVDVTFRVVGVPDNTPDDAELYIVGPFNRMDPGGSDNAIELRRDDDGAYSVTLPFDVGEMVEYKFTRGNWPSAEFVLEGDRFAFRELTVPDETITIDATINYWADLDTAPVRMLTETSAPIQETQDETQDEAQNSAPETVQVTFVVTVPENTPDDADVYINGPFNEWDGGAGDNAIMMNRNDDGTYSITLPFEAGQAIEYKFTRGSWASVEILGNDPFANHQHTVAEGDETISVDVFAWEDLLDQDADSETSEAQTDADSTFATGSVPADVTYEPVATDFASVSELLFTLEQIADDPEALDNLWWSLVAAERIPFTSGDQVLLLYRGDAETVDWRGDATNWEYVAQAEGIRLADTDIWYRDAIFPPDARLDYKIVLNGTEWILDPANPRQQWGGFGPNSELAMPEYVYDTNVIPRDDIAKGTLWRQTLIQSDALGQPVAYRVYTPANYADMDALPTIYVTDGHEYADQRLGAMVTVLDNLIADGAIEPVIAVFVDPRHPETGENLRADLYILNPDFARFLADELVPLIDIIYNTNDAPDARAILGTSLGGVNAAFVGGMHPDTFGLIAAQSPAIWTAPWLLDLYADSDVEPLKFFITTGAPELGDALAVFEDTQINSLDDLMALDNNPLATVLKDRGYPLMAYQVNEGHSWGQWRAQLDDMLLYFFGA